MAILCTVSRGSQLESFHVVYAVAVNSGGEVVFASGEADYLTCVRSSLKPFQAAASFKAGAVEAAGFDLKEQALMCASHNGEPIHVAAAISMMEKLGLAPEDYRCGAHEPYDRTSLLALHRSGGEATPYHNNCSGKHAGMLSLAKHLGADTETYLDIKNPVQKAIFDGLGAHLGRRDFILGVDGCSAPVPFLSLTEIAILYQKLVSGDYRELNGPFKAMTTHPEYMAGTGRFDTIFNAALKGRGVTKIGGEAVRGIGIRKSDGDTVGLALKVLDGNGRALPPATMALLKKLDLLTGDELKKLKNYESTILKNHRGIHTGNIDATFKY